MRFAGPAEARGQEDPDQVCTVVVLGRIMECICYNTVNLTWKQLITYDNSLVKQTLIISFRRLLSARFTSEKKKSETLSVVSDDHLGKYLRQ